MKNTKIIEEASEKLSTLDIDYMDTEEIIEVGRSEYILEGLLREMKKVGKE